MRRATVGDFGDKEEDDRDADASEDGDEVERPLPANRVGHLAHNDGRQEGAAEDGEVGDCHAFSSLVDEVEIADRGIDQRFEWCETDALEYACP